MIRFGAMLLLACCAAAVSFAGTPSYTDKSGKETIAPTACPEWYGNTEWNVTLWGTYAWVGTDGHAELGNTFQSNRFFTALSANELTASDRYLETDHAWGGGIDIKYFVRRYFGIGFEGFLVEAERSSVEIQIPSPVIVSVTRTDDSRIVGAALGTLTFRYPIHCSRLSPYIWAGGGGIFNGGEHDVLLVNRNPAIAARTELGGRRSEALGQFGGGLEFRFTRHLGWLNDFSWNVVEGPNNNFGMVRSGLSFSF